MKTKPRYDDVTGELSEWPRFPEHATWLDALARHGFTPLLAMQSDQRLTWSVMADESRTIAASVSLMHGHPSLYVVSALEDGSCLETQWRPLAQHLRDLGPGCLCDDVPALVWRRFTPRDDIDPLLEAHHDLVSEHMQRSPVKPWTARSYLRFRLTSRHRIHMNIASTLFLSMWLTLAAMLTLGALLLMTAPGWPLAAVAVGTAYVAYVLFGKRLMYWVGGVIIRSLSVTLRERLWLLMEEAEDDGA